MSESPTEFYVPGRGKTPPPVPSALPGESTERRIAEIEQLILDLMSAQDDVTHCNEAGLVTEMRVHQTRRNELRARIRQRFEAALSENERLRRDGERIEQIQDIWNSMQFAAPEMRSFWETEMQNVLSDAP